MDLLYLVLVLQVYITVSEIRTSKIINKLLKVRPVGANLARNFVPITELPPPPKPYHTHEPSGRRHFVEDCSVKPPVQEVIDGPKVDIFADYYDEKQAKTVASIIFPDHIDHKHFEVTTQVPYLTVGPIEGLGFHPSTIKSEHPSECEKIYQDHIDDQYSEESRDYSEESLEMARMPISNGTNDRLEEALADLYQDVLM